MDDLIAEFLTESNESVDMIDAGLVDFERNPDNSVLLHNIFRLVHTLKGTCGFLQMPRLEALSHAAETLMEGLRGDTPPTADMVTLILKSVDRIKLLLAQIEASDGTEPAGDDSALIAELEHRAKRPRLTAGRKVRRRHIQRCWRQAYGSAQDRASASTCPSTCQ